MMPRLEKERREALMVEVVRLRDDESMTFEAIAERLGFERRQQARLLYRAHQQRMFDREAQRYCESGISIPAFYADLISKRAEARLRRSHPRSFDLIDDRREAGIVRQAGDGEQTEASVLSAVDPRTEALARQIETGTMTFDDAIRGIIGGRF
jgi:hypothetical protein